MNKIYKMKGNIYLFQILIVICVGLVFNAENADITNFIEAMPEEEVKVISKLKDIDNNVAINYCEETNQGQENYCQTYVIVYCTYTQEPKLGFIPATIENTTDDNQDNSNSGSEEKSEEENSSDNNIEKEKDDNNIEKEKDENSEEEEEKIKEEKVKKILMKHNERLSLMKKWSKRKLDILTKKIMKKKHKK